MRIINYNNFLAFDRRYIYYQSGDLNRIRHLKMQFNSGEIVALEPTDIYNAAGIAKVFIRYNIFKFLVWT